MLQLTEIEARIVGSLVEKSFTTPEQYPLTYNSLLAACSQKTSREPVMTLDEAAAGPHLMTAIDKGLVERVNETGSRVPKFRHRADKLVGTEDAKITGVICVLLLRGAQTSGELKTRTERLCKFESTAEVESLLQDLAARPEPMVAKLPRQPGQKESRWTQLFTGPAPSAPVTPSAGDATVAFPHPQGDRVAELEKRLASLEARVQALEEKPNLVQD